MTAGAKVSCINFLLPANSHLYVGSHVQKNTIWFGYKSSTVT